MVNHKGEGVLHLAATSAPAVKMFLNRGLDINRRDAKGLTALHHAARHAADETIPLLLAAGADVDARDNDGNTPLHMIFFGDEFWPDIEFPTFQALVAGGAQKSIRNSQGETAFDLARRFSDPGEYLHLLDPR
ncbi:MAG: ankyrin repeat domain-containing protein [Nibricoccus sp.]